MKMYNFKHTPVKRKRRYRTGYIKLRKRTLHISVSVYVPGSTHVELHIDEVNRLAALRFTSEPTANYPLKINQLENHRLNTVTVNSTGIIRRLQELGYKQYEPIYPKRHEGGLYILPK